MTYRRPETITLREGGRVVIPASIRAELGVGPGDQLIATVENGELRLMTRATKIRRLQDRLVRLKSPGESVVDEFIAERRAEALRE